MTKTMELLFDFVSPNAYLIWHPLKDIALQHGARLEVTPVFLAGMHKLTGNAPPFIRDGEVKGKNAYAMLEMNRFIACHGLTRFRMNPNFPFNSITLQRILLAAEEAQRDALVELLLAQIWEEGLDVADIAMLSQVLIDDGFDAEALLARAQNAAIKQQLVDNTAAAVKRGAFGIPTMFVSCGGDDEAGQAMFFGKERLAQIGEMLTSS